MTGGWLSLPEGSDAAAGRLFCFAHAGGGGAFFQPWRQAMLPDIAVCPVVLPGREGRIRQRPYRRVEDILDPLCEALQPHACHPYALFGHSMGAVLAYEVARRLGAAGQRPLCLFASGRRAPQLPARHPPLHRLPDEQFLAAVNVLGGTPPDVIGDSELIRIFLPSLRADFELNETYPGPAGGRLHCPVSALTGDRDPEVNIEEMAAWQDTTDGGFMLRVFSGDHFYLKGARGEVLAAIRGEIRRLLPAALPS
ncbi:MAG TPA: alpha/beta fold hydrolase [Streptosporangiaceae bacterium]